MNCKFLEDDSQFTQTESGVNKLAQSFLTREQDYKRSWWENGCGSERERTVDEDTQKNVC